MTKSLTLFGMIIFILRFCEKVSKPAKIIIYNLGKFFILRTIPFIKMIVCLCNICLIFNVKQRRKPFGMLFYSGGAIERFLLFYLPN